MLQKKIYFLVTINFVIAAGEYLEPNIREDILEINSINPLETTGIKNSLGEDIENLPKDLLLSWQARRSTRKIFAQMPYGWPAYIVPSLAPYINDNLSFDVKNSILSTTTGFKPIRIDGLDKMEIKSLNVGLVFKRIKFDFIFPNLTFTGNFDTSTSINLQELINVKIAEIGGGKLQLSLKNLRISGTVRYKLPIISNSAKIYNLRTEMTLDDVSSELSGFINGVPIGRPLNNLIAINVLKYLIEFNYISNGLIEKYAVPVINVGLQNKTLWKIILWSISNQESISEFADLDYAGIQELHRIFLRVNQQ